MTKERKGYFYIIIFQVMAGFNTFAIKNINPEFPSSLLVLSRFGVASVFFAFIIFSQDKYRKELLKLSKKQIIHLVYLGALGSGVASAIYVLAVRSIGITLSTIIGNLEIPLGIVLAIIILKEKLTAGFVKVSGLILIGFFLLLARDAEISMQSAFFSGIVLAFIAAVIWASATLVGKQLLTANVSPVVVPFLRNLFATISAFLIALASATPIVSSYSLLNLSDWLWILYTGVGIVGVGFLLYYKALGAIEVKKISLFFTISPVISILLGIVSGEVLGVWQWVGVGAILVGIIALLRKPSKPVVIEEENKVV
ncbi:hypothetical protein A2773_05305 [Candidatus Gottesmanbacteria bacterium RIFCSPHIGHO2_01_FULL_39_10]|uniref:EamA domain-containing protein n=1 Tax=Candidatus Gottesmanbacteria bacterium RIFCSPHIGHO2_01_FULL_39_10 TaxID=1798375 RepID=A0A1F5ZNX2_9BACT|nr:MAG: hypothetical protein A2773_05305 [Candidatus Gottesmanbacteria bacterium RIFCSPHIGHO2_01_FULL_39_10]